MRNANAALTSFLLSKQPCTVADLFEFNLFNGQQHFWTSSDQTIHVNGSTYVNVGPALTRTKFEVKNTIDVPTMDISLISTGSDFGGQNIKLAIHNGLLDGAHVTLKRVFMPTPGDTSLGTVTLFGGRTSTVQISGRGAKITVKGDNVIMQQYMPRNVYNLSCIHTLYDAGCTLSAATFSFFDEVAAPTNAIAITLSIAGGSPQYNLGYVTITTGAGAGQIRTILNANATTLLLAYPLYVVPAPGDQLSVTYGCDKRSSTCLNVFNNLQHFRGFEAIPPAVLGA